jgi:hypothetical protein
MYDLADNAAFSAADQLMQSDHRAKEIAQLRASKAAAPLDPFDPELTKVVDKPYAETPWEVTWRALATEKPEGGAAGDFWDAVTAAHTTASDSRNRAPLDRAFRGVIVTSEGVMTRGPVDVTPVSTPAWVYMLSKFLAHTDFGIDDAADVLFAREAASYYRLQLAARACRWTVGDGRQVLKALMDGTLARSRQRTVPKARHGDVKRSSEDLSAVKAVAEEQRAYLHQASVGAARMQAARATSARITLGTVALVAAVNGAYWSLRYRRPNLLHNRSLAIQVGAGLAVVAVAVTAFAQRMRAIESFGSIPVDYLEDIGAASIANELDRQMAGHHEAVDAASADVRELSTALSRRKEHAQMTYSDLRFSERRERRRAGVAQLCLALTMVAVVMGQSGRMSTGKQVAAVYGVSGLVVVLALAVAHASDKTRFRTNWSQFYFAPPTKR